MRTVTGILQSPAGLPLRRTAITFTLVDEFGKGTDAFVAATHERIAGSAETKTDTTGAFSISLTENGLLESETFYLVEAEGLKPFVSQLPEGDVAMDWLDFRMGGEPVSPADIDVLQQRIDLAQSYADAAAASSAEVDMKAGEALAALEVKTIFGTIVSPRLHVPLQNDIFVASGAGSVTFSRASAASYCPEDGKVAFVDAEVPRFEKSGLLLERASTNLITNSDDLGDFVLRGSAALSDSAALSPDGITTARRLELPAVDDRIDFNFNANLGSYYTGSVWMLGTAGETVTVEFTNFSSGLPSNRVTFTGRWQRVPVTIAMDDAVDTNGYFQIRNDGDTSGVMYVKFAQLEERDCMTSYIRSLSSPGARDADMMRVDYAYNNITNGSDVTLLLDFVPLPDVISPGSVGSDPLYFTSDAGAINLGWYRFGFCVSYNGDGTSSLRSYLNGVAVSSEDDTLPHDFGGGRIALGDAEGHYHNLRLYDRCFSVVEMALA